MRLNDAWEQDEDARLLLGVLLYGLNFVAVARFVQTRDSHECQERYYQQTHANTGYWTPEGDPVVRQVLVITRDMIAIARVSGRTATQILAGWNEYLNPAINNSEEEYIIFLHGLIENTWEVLVSFTNINRLPQLELTEATSFNANGNVQSSLLSETMYPIDPAWDTISSPVSSTPAIMEDESMDTPCLFTQEAPHLSTPLGDARIFQGANQVPNLPALVRHDEEMATAMHSNELNESRAFDLQASLPDAITQNPYISAWQPPSYHSNSMTEHLSPYDAQSNSLSQPTMHSTTTPTTENNHHVEASQNAFHPVQQGIEPQRLHPNNQAPRQPNAPSNNELEATAARINSLIPPGQDAQAILESLTGRTWQNHSPWASFESGTMKARVSLERWLDGAREILQQERQAEIAQSKLENDTLPVHLNPNVLLNLVLSSSSTGLFGRTVMVLKLSFDRVLPSHHFGIGDLVQLSIPTASTPIDESPKAIVTKVQEAAITIAFEDLDDADTYANQPLRLDRLVNDATYRKLNEGIDRLAKYTDGPAMPILNVVFHGAEPQANPIQHLESATAASMNPSQIEAIEYAIASKDIALIHGPPGTGKTTTVVELITHCVVKQKMKILVCAPSNIAVDNVLEKLAATKPKFRMTRVGHPARLLPQVLQYCLDARIQSADGTQIVSDIRKEMASLQTKMAKKRKQRNKSGVYEMRKECQLLRKEIRDRERKVVGEIIQHSDVIFATNAGASTKLLKDMVFDLVIIDEAAQALEASCWIPLLMGKRCVLAGDHLQLPPTIKSDEAARKHMTLFDRITKMDSTKHVVKMLSTQYRMHADISNWASNAMYDGKLESSQAVATRKIGQLSHVNHTTELTDATLLLLDTAGCELEEDEEDASAVPLLQMSKSNKGEANVVVQHVKALLSTGLKPVDIAVITPYNAQVQLLKQLLLADYPTLEIRSVDGFQGCEKEAVVMSLVRSNAKKQVGFLADDRRMNVAITRAKRHVALICDTDTVSNHPFLKNLVEYFEAHGEYRSAEEYIENDSTSFDSKALLAELQNTESQSVVQETIVSKPSQKSQSKAKKATATPPAKAKVDAVPPKSSPPLAEESKAPPEKVSSPIAKAATTVDIDDGSVAPSTSSNAVEMSLVDDNTESTDVQEEKEQISQVKADASAFELLMDDSSSSDEEKENTTPEAPPTNSLLKDLHKERVARQVAAKAATQAPKSASQSSSKKKKKKKAKDIVRVEAVAEKAAEEDDLAFLNRIAAKANNCSFIRCKQNTSLLGSICRFCNLKFCYNHGQPEVHGCGDAVRAFERERAALQSTPVKSQSYQSKEKRKLLQKALDTKIAAKTTDRKTKAKPKQ